MKKLFIAAVAAFTMTFAFAGDKGNGGGAYVYQDQSGTPVYAELEDFVEWAIYEGVDFSSRSIPSLEQVYQRLLSYDPVLAIYVKENYEMVKKEFESGRRPIRFEPATSSNGIFKKVRLGLRDNHSCNDCVENGGAQFETAAKYTSRGLIVSRPIVHAMPRVDQVGLLYHELIYKGLRELYRHINSDVARKVVADVFNIQGKKLIENEYGDYIATLRLTDEHYEYFMKAFEKAQEVGDLEDLKEEATRRSFSCHYLKHDWLGVNYKASLKSSNSFSIALQENAWTKEYVFESERVYRIGNFFIVPEDREDWTSGTHYAVCKLN